MTAGWDHARAVADAVLYEGYLLYPYRANSRKNQSRWQFGVLGPQGAADTGIGEDATLSAQVLVQSNRVPSLSGTVRFLQLQYRGAERDVGGRFEQVDELTTGSASWISWDEAVEREIAIQPFPVTSLPRTLDISVPAGADIEVLDGGRLVRTRRALLGQLDISAEHDGELLRLSFEMRNVAPPAADKDKAIATSLIGTHLLIEVTDGEFVSLLEPPDSAAAAVARCRQHRCFPVLAGPAGAAKDLVLVSPIILYDHPEIAEQSKGALYDACEIDEILTLRIMTMTDEEKAQARATDPLAAEIIDRSDSMSPEAMLDLHGVLRNPHAPTKESGLIPEVPTDVDWWDPMADNAVRPELDAILVNGTPVARGSRVRLHPSRRADAQDLFYADKIARVTSVHEDVDGDQHVGVVLDDDPAADLHDWYGRYLYFAPDEVEPLNERSSKWR
jgi:hypothetical protein